MKSLAFLPCIPKINTFSFYAFPDFVEENQIAVLEVGDRFLLIFTGSVYCLLWLAKTFTEYKLQRGIAKFDTTLKCRANPFLPALCYPAVPNPENASLLFFSLRVGGKIHLHARGPNTRTSISQNECREGKPNSPNYPMGREALAL